MANHLVRITENDYREYRRSYSKISYSLNKKGEPRRYDEDAILKSCNEESDKGIFCKQVFLDVIAQSEKYELYFFKNDDEQIIGVMSLYFSEKSCFIAEFAVFERGKGLGTELFALALEVMRHRNVRLIELISPPSFGGAREFWKKLGFSLKYKSDREFEKPIRFRYQASNT